MKKALLVITALFFFSFSFAQGYSAADIISKSKTAYGSTKTYFDSGKVVSSFYNNARPFSNAKIFKTAYSRTGLFNFEYYDVGRSNSLYVINQNMKLVQSWWGITGKTISYSSIANPLAAAAGVSSSLSALIPRLLFFTTGEGKTMLDPMVPAKDVTKEIINGASCFVVKGKGVKGNDLHFWIGDNDFLIRKVITDSEVKDFKVKSTYQFFPYQPARSMPELFVFRPNRQVEL